MDIAMLLSNPSSGEVAATCGNGDGDNEDGWNGIRNRDMPPDPGKEDMPDFKDTFAMVARKRKSADAGPVLELQPKKFLTNTSIRIPKINLWNDMLMHFIQSRTPPPTDAICATAAIPDCALEDWLEDSHKMGVCLFFMRRGITGLQVRGWIKAVAPDVIPSQVIFLVRSCFYIHCTDASQKFTLLARNASWGNGLFALSLPWDETFDPATEFGFFCPVWVLLKEVPVFLLPHLIDFLACLGKVLYVPSYGSYIHSRTFKVCILRELNKEVPSYIKILVHGRKDALYVQVQFDPFPLACFNCNRIGHYVKTCPLKQEERSKPYTSEETSMREDILQEGRCAAPIFPTSPRVLRTSTTKNRDNCVECPNPFEALSHTTNMDGNIEGTFNKDIGQEITESKTKGRKSNRKKKNLKKKKVTDSNKEKEPIVTASMYIELNSNFEGYNNASEDKEEDLEDAKEGENDVESANDTMDSTSIIDDLHGKEDLKETVKLDTSDILEVDYFIRVSKQYHKYYDFGSKVFKIPATILKEEGKIFLIVEDVKWSLFDFVSRHNFRRGELVVESKFGVQPVHITYV